MFIFIHNLLIGISGTDTSVQTTSGPPKPKIGKIYYIHLNLFQVIGTIDNMICSCISYVLFSMCCSRIRWFAHTRNDRMPATDSYDMIFLPIKVKHYFVLDTYVLLMHFEDNGIH